jgi:hypothetical protein
MLVALAVMGCAAVYVAWNKTWTIGNNTVPFGKYALIIFGLLLLVGHFLKKKSPQGS